MILFPFISLLLGVHQWNLQDEIHYSSHAYVSPYLGFWLTVVSVGILLISFRRSSEWALLKRFKTKKAALSLFLILLICFSGFVVVNELQSQAKITKRMVVEKVVQPEELPGDAKLWEIVDYNRIVAVATVFRARVRYNSPNYYYCVPEVPVISYKLLMVVYHLMGYHAYEEPVYYLC